MKMPDPSNPHVLLAYRFDGKGRGIPIAGKAISDSIKGRQLAWVHMDLTHPESRNWLDREIDYLDPFIRDALLAEETRPRMTQIEDGMLLILRGVNLNEESDPEDMVSIRMWIDAHRIISLQRRKLKVIQDLGNSLEEGKGPKNAGSFVATLSSLLSDQMAPVLAKLDERTDAIEEEILESAEVMYREEIVNVRKQAILFRRHMAPQREAITKLSEAQMTWLTDNDKRQLRETFNHLLRYVEDLDALRERAQVIKDELVNLLSDRLNKNMYVLSVIAAIFLPLGFLTGLLGINVGGIPGADNSHAFYLFCGILLFLVICQIVIFKKLKWF